MLDDFGKLLSGEWAVISGAPMSFIAAVLVVGFFIWRAMEWRYGGIIAHAADDVSWAKAQLERANEERSRHHASAVSTDEATQSPAIEQPTIEPATIEPSALEMATQSLTQEQRRFAGIDEKGERVFLPDSMTLEKLMELETQKPRTVANDRLIESHKRMWTRFSGVVSSSGFHEGEIVVRLKAESGDTLREVFARTTALWFQQWPDRLEQLSEDDAISGIGLIEDIDYMGVTLTACELDS